MGEREGGREGGREKAREGKRGGERGGRGGGGEKGGREGGGVLEKIEPSSLTIATYNICIIYRTFGMFCTHLRITSFASGL